MSRRNRKKSDSDSDCEDKKEEKGKMFIMARGDLHYSVITWFCFGWYFA